MEEKQIPQPRPQSQLPLTTPLRAAPAKSKLTRVLPFIVIIVIIAFGGLTGLVVSSRTKSQQIAQGKAKAAISEENLSQDQKASFSQTFRDQAEGTIEKNDKLDKYAQGTHRLIRPGGESQTAYLTSSVLDLDAYVGKKVKVYGETFGSSQVGWLMDVGKVEIVN